MEDKKQDIRTSEVFGYVMAVLFPVVGFLLGVGHVWEGTRHGWWIILTSIASVVVYAIIMTALGE